MSGWPGVVVENVCMFFVLPINLQRCFIALMRRCCSGEFTILVAKVQPSVSSG